MLTARPIRYCLPAVALIVALAGCSRTTPAFPGDRAWRYLLDQCDLGPRPPGTDAHRRTIQYIVDRLTENGAKVTLQRFEMPDPYGERTLELTNIIGSFAPSRGKRVLVAAHFDTRPRADQETADSLKALPILGANDGASGVAVLLALSDVLAARAPRGLGVDLVFFDGEDYGREGDVQYYLLGSKHFAANLGGYRPRCGVVLDMVGARDARIPKERNSLAEAGELVGVLFERARVLGLNVFVDEPGVAVLDDHVPLLRAGIPAVDLIHFDYPQWHTLSDTPAACSEETLRQVGTLMVDFLYNFPF